MFYSGEIPLNMQFLVYVLNWFVAYKALIQAVLLSVFEQRMSFLMFYFIKNDQKIIAKCRWDSWGVVRSATGSWWSPGGGSGGKDPEKLWSFYIWRSNK